MNKREILKEYFTKWSDPYVYGNDWLYTPKPGFYITCNGKQIKEIQAFDRQPVYIYMTNGDCANWQNTRVASFEVFKLVKVKA